MKGRRRTKYIVIVTFETLSKMLISFVIYQKASPKATARRYFRFISISPGLEYFGDTELDWEFLMSPMISWGVKRNCRTHYQYFEMFGKESLLAYPQQALPCADRTKWGNCHDYFLLASASLWILIPCRKPARSSESCSSLALSSRSALFLLCAPPTQDSSPQSHRSPASLVRGAHRLGAPKRGEPYRHSSLLNFSNRNFYDVLSGRGGWFKVAGRKRIRIGQSQTTSFL